MTSSNFPQTSPFHSTFKLEYQEFHKNHDFQHSGVLKMLKMQKIMVFMLKIMILMKFLIFQLEYGMEWNSLTLWSAACLSVHYSAR